MRPLCSIPPMDEARTLKIEYPKGSQTLHLSTDARHHPILDLLRHAALPLNARCGGHGRCNGCLVELLAGSLIHIATGNPVAATATPMTLRACEHRPCPDANAVIRVPTRSLLAYEPLVLTDFSVNIPYAHDPLFQHLQVNRPHADDPPAKHAALCDAVARQLADQEPVRLEHPAIAQLATLPDAPNLIATVQRQIDHWAITQLSSRLPFRPVGAAIDIGTTTVVVLLVDLTDGRILAKAVAFNHQIHIGDDVVTRISLCSQKPHMLPRLQEAVAAKTIVPLLEQAAIEAHVSPNQIVCLTIVGNTTMLHLFAGVDPSPMGVAPFTPAFLDHRLLRPADVFHPAPPATAHAHAPDAPLPPTIDHSSPVVSPSASIHLLPSAAAYIGADLTAGILATGLLYDDGPSLLVDVGTNGEIILKHANHLLACATAAGPAFEGAGLTCGIRAGYGAISRVSLRLNPLTVHIKIIGHDKNIRPAGLCGSAYIDFLAQARYARLITPVGRFDLNALPEAQDRIHKSGPNDLAFILAHAHGNRHIAISQLDIAHLLQAKAAIAAGILILLNQASLRPDQIKRLYLAGGFGTHMNRQHAIDCGLLPGFRKNQVQAVGNTALAGAYVTLLDSNALAELARIRKHLQIVELNLDPDFEGTYIDQLRLP